MRYQILLIVVFVLLVLLLLGITYYLHTKHIKDKHVIEIFVSLLIVITVILTLFYNFVNVENIEYDQNLKKNKVDVKHNDQLLSRNLISPTLLNIYDVNTITTIIHTFNMWDNLLILSHNSKFTLHNIAHRIALTSQYLTADDLIVWDNYKNIYHNITQEIGNYIFTNLTNPNLATGIYQIMLKNKM